MPVDQALNTIIVLVTIGIWEFAETLLLAVHSVATLRVVVQADHQTIVTDFAAGCQRT